MSGQDETKRLGRTSSTSARFYFSRSWPVLLAGAVITLASLGTALHTHRPEWAVIGGSLLMVLGIPLTFLRLLRRGPAGVDDPDPPMTLPPPPGAVLVQFNMAWMWAGVERILENFGVITGVVLLIVGTILAGIVAPVLALMCQD